MLTEVEAKVFVRLWFVGDDLEVETYEDALEPVVGNGRSGATWAYEHLVEGYQTADLRKMLAVPDGDQQVVFRATIRGGQVGWESPEWDEEMDFEGVRTVALPADHWRLQPDMREGSNGARTLTK